MGLHTPIEYKVTAKIVNNTTANTLAVPNQL